MSAATDGSDKKADNAKKDTSSYAMLPSDRKAIAVARSSSARSESQIAAAKKNFMGKSSLGLWWDAKGIFSSSNVADVTEHMEKYRKFYEGVVIFSGMVEKGDPKSYHYLLDLYEELSEMDMDAQRDVKKNKSKALCRILRDFLSEKYKLDHDLKKVECVVLKQKIGEVEQTCERSREAVVKIGEDMNKLLEENRKIKEYMKDSSERAKDLQEENQMCKSLVDRLSREKEEFKEAMEKKLEELSLEADRRCAEVRRESDKKLREVLEEAEKRSEERFERMVTQMREAMKHNNNP